MRQLPTVSFTCPWWFCFYLLILNAEVVAFNIYREIGVDPGTCEISQFLVRSTLSSWYVWYFSWFGLAKNLNTINSIAVNWWKMMIGFKLYWYFTKTKIGVQPFFFQGAVLLYCKKIIYLHVLQYSIRTCHIRAIFCDCKLLNSFSRVCFQLYFKVFKVFIM